MSDGITDGEAMTHADIDKMPAGPELDRLACEALGIAPIPYMQGSSLIPMISTWPNDALRAMGKVRGMTLRYGHDKDGEWTAKALVSGFAYEKYVEASADTAALAIARAIALIGTVKA